MRRNGLCILILMIFFSSFIANVSALLITSIQCQPGSIDVQVKNDGSASEAFTYGIQCNTITQLYNPSTVSIPLGETKIISIPISGYNDVCKVTVSDWNYPSKYFATSEVTCKGVDVSVSAPAQCQEGKQTCSYDNIGLPVIKECQEGKQEIVQTCYSSQVCDSNGYSLFCRGKTPDNNSQNNNTSIVMVVILVVIVFALILMRRKKK